MPRTRLRGHSRGPGIVSRRRRNRHRDQFAKCLRSLHPTATQRQSVHGQVNSAPAASGQPTLTVGLLPGTGDGEPVVDMSRVVFCDSRGLSALIRAHLRARGAGAQLRLLRPTEPVTALLRRNGAARVLRASPAPVVREPRGSGGPRRVWHSAGSWSAQHRTEPVGRGRGARVPRQMILTDCQTILMRLWGVV
ncbi:STAS domain-containing protein [Kitasatospora purpeofusca]|uniref:STAS domain-containing protein n=1 Tax=Kitasatospora purpeofusca TaxID=67352 RepID=UPI003668B750